MNNPQAMEKKMGVMQESLLEMSGSPGDAYF